MSKNGSNSVLRTCLVVCTAVSSHVTMSSLLQHWPVSTGSETALHEPLGIIKINFQLPKQITRINAFSFPLFWVVFVPLLSSPSELFFQPFSGLEQPEVESWWSLLQWVSGLGSIHNNSICKMRWEFLFGERGKAQRKNKSQFTAFL